MFPVLALCLVVSSNIASVLSSSLTVSRSSVVIIGDRVELKCNGSDWTKWACTAWNTSTETDIYYGGQIVVSMRSRYKVDKSISKQHNIIIDSVDFTYAGRYRCIDVIQETLSTDIYLNVLGSIPVCAASTTESHVDRNKQTHLIIWCSISYTGTWFPVFIWTKSNAEKIIAANTTSSGTGRGPLTKTSLIMQQLHANDNGVTFQCQITFQLPNNSERVYVFTWNYTLPYGPRNLSIVEYEDRLVCSADANPTPTYRWTNVETNISTNGHVYILNRNSVNEHTFECTATNSISDESKPYTIKGASDVPITALAIGGGSLLFLLIVAILSFIVRSRRLKDDSSVRPDVALTTDLTLYDDTAPSSVRSSNNILKGDNLPGRSDSRTISDNPVYAEVWKPRGPSKGSKGSNTDDNSQPPQIPNRERKIVIEDDGWECAELSGVKPSGRKGEVPKPPAFSQVEIYASIDRSGKVPAPPLLPEL